MDFSLGEETTRARAAAAEAMDKLAGSATDTTWPNDAAWRAVVDAGLLDLAKPVDRGVNGIVATVFEEAGRRLLQIPLVPTLTVVQAMAQHGSEQLRERWLPSVLDGSTFVTAGLGDEFGRQYVGGLTATTDGPNGGWIVSGQQFNVPFGAMASAIVAPARVEDGRVVLLVLDTASEGIRVEEQQVTNGAPDAVVHVDRISVGPGDVLAAPDEGAEILRWLWCCWVTGWCATNLGVVAKALESAATYSTTREQFGRPVGSFQATATHAANARISLEIMKVTMQQAAWRLDAELPAEREVHIASYWSARGSRRVAQVAQHLHGGVGLMLDNPAQRHFLWARQLELSWGTGPWHLHQLGALLATESESLPA